MRQLSLVFTVLFLLLLSSSTVVAQDSISKKMKSPSKKINKVAEELRVSLDENDESKIASNYEAIAQVFIDKNDNEKAEVYLKKALNSYTKLNSIVDKARVTRVLAKIQENQSKYKEAISNYDKASDISATKKAEQMNSNDANRLRSASSPAAQASYAKSNIEILVKERKKDLDKEEVTQAYVQNAEANLKQSNKQDAIKSYEKAIVYANEKPEDVIKLKNEISKVYVSDNKFDEAIAINQKLLADAKKNNDFDTQITQLQLLATVYFKKNDSDKAINFLKKAYELATKNGKTNEVKKSLSALLSYYKSKGNDKESIALYDGFFQNFDQLIKKDTTLIDAKVFQVTEDKIKQLEKEKTLKDELISKKNTFNYFLIGAFLLLLLFFALIAKALFSIKRKNKEIALQSLRREMNPHFIFNSLNSVNQFISQNKELEANKYLTSYSNLMRNNMENSNKDFVTLSNEIEQLTKYLDLEHMRFQDKFSFTIFVDEKLDPETTLVPNMIIQPHLENAIWHGLRYLKTKGFLQLRFELFKGKFQISIEDDGIGLTKSKALKTKNQKVYESRGMTNTNERIKLLNDLYKSQIEFQISEKKLPETGTIVKINFPLIEKIG